jgi:outer membrane protein assembly factor BamB
LLCLVWLLAAAELCPAAAPATPPTAVKTARQIFDATGVQGGLIVHLGCGDGSLTAALRAGDAYLVHGLDKNPANVEAARRRVRAAGLYGPVSVDLWSGGRLPYIDNLVNLLVIEDADVSAEGDSPVFVPPLRVGARKSGQSPIPRDEMLRVLAPNGVAYVKTGAEWVKTVKPRPKDLDEWTQYLHGAGNNAVAHDAQVGPPRHLQWLVEPKWSRHHDHMASLSAMVSAGGRVFYIVDEGPREAILLPAKWMLLARDAFNGTLLWKQPIAEWNTHLWPLKSGPNQLPRRLVAVGDRVYVTLGIDAPLVALDAATGKTLHTFKDTQHTDEVVADDGLLFLLVANSPNKWKDYRPKSTYVWANTNRANSEWAWDKEDRKLVAVRADGSEVLWTKEHRVAPLTLAVDRDRVYFYDGEKAVALSRKTGQPLWTSEPVLRKTGFPTGYGPTLVVEQGVVLLSVEPSSMTAFDAADGRTLWTAKKNRGGHASPDDMLVVNGLVWSGAVANGADSGVFTGRDLRSGEVKSEFPPDVKPDWFHHRCYRSRATEKYFIASRTGIEFIDLAAKHWDINHWVRGGCLYGFMPANGLLYVPSHSCGCFLESKLFGINVLAGASPTRQVPRDVPEQDRLERGPAWGQIGQRGTVPVFAGTMRSMVAKTGLSPSAQTVPVSFAKDDNDWPTYRHDPARSGATKTPVPAELRKAWQVDLGGKLSSVTVAGGRVFLAAIDRHTLYALDAASGKTAWTFTAGARIDSPPTIYRGCALFGAADGWVYCLDAADGRLAWRFRAAPLDRRLMAYEQLESAWPVSGSVLVEGGAVCCVAGRSAFLDGGMRLVRLDPLSGKKLSETLLDDRIPHGSENLQSQIKGQDMPVALPDILSSDGRSIYMRSQAFDLKGVRRETAPLKLRFASQRAAADAADAFAAVGDHLFSRSGFLDDSWFFRSYWLFGREVDSNYGGWLRPGHFAPSGRLMVFDETSLYAFARKPEYLCNASVQEYYVYGAGRQTSDEARERVRAATTRIDTASTEKSASSSDWATRKKFSLAEQSVADYRWAQGNPPIQARAMVLAGKTLFLAGPPDLLDEEEALRNPDAPAIKAKLDAQAEALQGRRGGQLLAVSAADGKLLSALELGAMPTFDGMAAASGRLYVTTVDGRVLCLGAEGEKLPAATGAALAPLDVSVKISDVPAVAPKEPAKKAGPSLKGEFARVVRAKVTKSDMGCRVKAEGKNLGFAVKKLDQPLQGKIHLKVKMQVAADSKLKNGFLVFGDAAEDAALVKCGLRIAAGKAVIVQGAMAGGKVADAATQADAAVPQEIDVAVDLATGQITMKAGAATVTAKWESPPKEITHVGYGVLDATVDFTAVESN